MKHFPLKTFFLFILIAVLIILSFVLFESDIENLMKRGIEYAGENLLLVSIVLFLTLASDIFLPVPSCLASSLCGMLLGGCLGFVVSFLAMSTSSAIGFYLGWKAHKKAIKILGQQEVETLSAMHKKSGTVFLLALRPVPILAETSLIFAGLAKMPIKKTFLYVSLGNIVVSSIYAITGAYLRSFENSTLLVFGVCVLLSLLFILIPWIFKITGNRKCRIEAESV